MEKKKKRKWKLYYSEIRKHLGAGYIDIFPEACNCKNKKDDDNSFKKNIGNLNWK